MENIFEDLIVDNFPACKKKQISKSRKHRVPKKGQHKEDHIKICCTQNEKKLKIENIQVHMEHSPGQITHQATKQAQVNSGKLKSFKAYFSTTMLRDQKSTSRGKKWKKKTHKHKEVKQYTTKKNGYLKK